MNKTLRTLVNTIKEGKYNNTYKMCWIRSIIEILILKPNKKQISFEELSTIIFKNYWNQTIFFNLNQGPINQKPGICKIVESNINEYKKNYGHQPIFYERVSTKIKIDKKKICNLLKENVSWRFLDKNNSIYKLDKNNETLYLKDTNTLKKYADLLLEIINYKWTEILEDFNSSPRISKKVNGTYKKNIKRGNLKNFKKFLDIENPNRLDFVTGKKIIDNNLSIHHVIPWSYMYSDDLWNLVYLDKTINSKISNRQPREKDIKKLELRNLKLLKTLEKKKNNNKIISELRLAIENNYVRKFWISFKG